ncbi:MAG: ABC transporter ATP-binding protein/permease [Blautia sp.]|nr:ABC transporter ATP-binding protein/permease [Blautia sp.]
MTKNMTVKEMWHYTVFQTKGYRSVQAGIVIGALTAAAVPYAGSIFYAAILNRLMLTEYGAAAGMVLRMTAVTVILNLAAKACDRIVQHYCNLCEPEIKKRTAQKAFSMEYEMIDTAEALAAFRRVRAGEQGMGGVERQLLEIYQFFRELAGIVFAAGFILVLFASTDSEKENMTVSVLLFVLLLLALAAVMAVSNYFSKKDGEFAVKTERENERVNTLTAYLFGLIGKEEYIKDIRLFGLGDYLYRKMKVFQSVGRVFTEKGCYTGKCQAVSSFAAQILAAVTYICIAAKALAGSITVGEVTMYASAVIAMAAGAQRMLEKYQNINYMNEYLNTYEEFITQPNMHYDGTLPTEKRDDNRYLIEFSHVSFRYPGTEQDVLRDVSITFHVGERLALVGQNGAGKTTLIKLLCRLYEPTEGEIRLNGINIAKYDYDEYARIFSVVFQDFRLYDFPLDENVSCGQPVEEERLKEVLMLSGMWERVQELPERQKTLLGHENGQGVSLSGGEAQKIAIARALYKDAPFIILDEPTASLDPLAEAEIYENFDTLIRNKTAIYISHRMSSCKFCDRIVVFGEGKIMEEGNHESLLAERGIYYRLYNAQAKYYKNSR